MASIRQRRPPTEEETVGFADSIFFNYVTPVLEAGFREPLKRSHIPSVPKQHDATVARRKFQDVWETERTRPSPSLLRTVFFAFNDRFRSSIGLELFDLVLAFFLPLLNQAIMEFQMSTSRTIAEGVVYCFIGFLIRTGMAVLGTQSGRIQGGISLDVHTALMSATYDEALKLKGGKFSKGDIMSVQSMDTSSVSSFLLRLNRIWTTPANVCISLALLLTVIGPSALVGVGVMMLIFPFESLVFWAMASLRVQLLYFNDQRLSYMNEMLTGIRVVKFQGMEEYFKGRIIDVRRREIILNKRMAYWSSAISVVFQLFPIVYSTVTYLTFASMGNILTPAVIFTTSSLFGNLRGPLSQLPGIVSSVAAAQASIRRIERLLVASSDEAKTDRALPQTNLAINVNNASFAWSDGAPNVLNEVELQVRRGELVGVIGRVGAGKSSLLAAVCGDLTVSEGDPAQVNGRISYASQTPFLLAGTLRENILFGSAFVEKDYKECIAAAQLKTDIVNLGRDMDRPGDEALISEGGANLSGGQRQRVNLARAVYHNGDIVLLDDPLSALDPKVAKKVFAELVIGRLRGKTRLLVTHQHQFLKYCDRILIMDGGRIVWNGAPTQFAHDREIQTKYADLASDLPGTDTQFDLGEERESFIRTVSALSDPSRRDVMYEPERRVVTTSAAGDEEQQEGAVKMEMFVWYLTHCGRVLYFYIVFLVSAQLLRLQGDLFQSYFADRRFVTSSGGDPGVLFYVGLQMATGLIGSMSSLLDGLAKVEAGMEAAWRLHNKMLANVLRAPMSFFDRIPAGRILSRFSGDLDQLDSGVADQLAGVVSLLFTGASTVVVLITMMPSILVAFIPLTSVYFFLMQRYRSTSREISRLVAGASAPMYAHVAETLNGLTTIRAYGTVERFVRGHDEAVNEYNAVSWCSSNVGRWLSIRLDFIGATVAMVTSLLVILDASLPPGVAGMLMAYSGAITSILESSVTIMSRLENEMNSVGRVRFYTEKIVREGLDIVEPRPPLDWMSPDVGVGGAKVEVSGLNVAYEGDKLVLQNVTFNVTRGEKIGIVGRTGSGKSTLLQCLIRMVEAKSGDILMDAVDVRTIGLRDLRSRVAIIPQEPVLFSGTVRSNIDPSSKHSDEAIWDALDRAHCRNLVESMDKRLYSAVTDGGKNYSIGERQLLCLARALLRGNTLLLMDEATANVDLETDALIQDTVKQSFRDCTVVSVAHRLDTIMGYDKILVMQDGRVVQYDRPDTLLQATDSLFAQMVRDSGREQDLREMMQRAES